MAYVQWPSASAPTCRQCRRPEKRPLRVLSAGKGFGKTSEAPAPRKRQKPNTKDEVLQAARGAPVRGVDPKEAAKGRLDYVQVRDWGSGKAGDLGDLQVIAHGHSAASEAAPNLYTQLTLRLQELEAQGALRIAQSAFAAPPPPFERWSLARGRYVQWLADQHAVHYVLESAIGDALAMQGESLPTGKAGVAAQRGPWAALAHLGEACGLHRSLELATDLQKLSAAGEEADGPGPDMTAPSPHAAAYAQYLASLSAVHGDTAEDRGEAVLRLLANTYALHVTHLTSGMRIGAAAAERLGLFRLRALHFFQTYPSHVGRDPKQRLIRAVDAAGQKLNAAERATVAGELPLAFPKVSLLLTVLAHAD